MGSRGRSHILNKTPDIKSQLKKNEILSISNNNSNGPMMGNNSNNSMMNQMMVRGRSDKAHTTLAQYTSHELPRVNLQKGYNSALGHLREVREISEDRRRKKSNRSSLQGN